MLHRCIYIYISRFELPHILGMVSGVLSVVVGSALPRPTDSLAVQVVVWAGVEDGKGGLAAGGPARLRGDCLALLSAALAGAAQVSQADLGCNPIYCTDRLTEVILTRLPPLLGHLSPPAGQLLPQRVPRHAGAHRHRGHRSPGVCTALRSAIRFIVVLRVLFERGAVLSFQFWLPEQAAQAGLCGVVVLAQVTRNHRTVLTVDDGVASAGDLVPVAADCVATAPPRWNLPLPPLLHLPHPGRRHADTHLPGTVNHKPSTFFLPLQYAS